MVKDIMWFVESMKTLKKSNFSDSHTLIWGALHPVVESAVCALQSWFVISGEKKTIQGSLVKINETNMY